MRIMQGTCASENYVAQRLRQKHGIQAVQFLPCRNALISKDQDLVVFLRDGDPRPSIAVSGKWVKSDFIVHQFQLDGVDWKPVKLGRCDTMRNAETGHIALECWAVAADGTNDTALVARLVTDATFPAE